jgi:hypothetical protein
MEQLTINSFKSVWQKQHDVPHKQYITKPPFIPKKDINIYPNTFKKNLQIRQNNP